MYTIIEVGNRQYRVQEGSVIDVDLQDKKEGAKFKIKNVLLVVDKDKVTIGKPYVNSAQVSAQVVKHYKGKKVVAFTYRRRKNSKSKKGMRVKLTQIKIDKIEI